MNAARLKSLVAVLEVNDPALPFVASCFALVLRKGKLSPKQSASCALIEGQIARRRVESGGVVIPFRGSAA